MAVPRILLIEDDDDLRNEIQEYLTRRQNSVRGCATIADARRALDERLPDIVISDIRLPDGNGITFCLEYAAMHPATKWLLMSGDPTLIQQSRQLKRTPDALPFSVLDKPVPMTTLTDFIRLAMMPAARKWSFANREDSASSATPRDP